MTLELWGTRNTTLHRTTPEEKWLIQGHMAIEVATKTIAEEFRKVQLWYPILYRKTCQQLCDISTLQILKWIEAFDTYGGGGALHR